MPRCSTLYKRACGKKNTYIANDYNEGLVLQDKIIWKQFIEKDIVREINAYELYFEEYHVKAFVQKLDELYHSIKYVHRLVTHRWGRK